MGGQSVKSRAANQRRQPPLLTNLLCYLIRCHRSPPSMPLLRSDPRIQLHYLSHAPVCHDQLLDIPRRDEARCNIISWQLIKSLNSNREAPSPLLVAALLAAHK
jgi:hypothetical protein